MQNGGRKCGLYIVCACKHGRRSKCDNTRLYGEERGDVVRQRGKPMDGQEDAKTSTNSIVLELSR